MKEMYFSEIDTMFVTDKFCLKTTDVERDGWILRNLDLYMDDKCRRIGAYYSRREDGIIEKAVCSDLAVAILRKDGDWIGYPPKMEEPPHIERLFLIPLLKYIDGTQEELLNIYASVFPEDKKEIEIGTIKLGNSLTKRKINKTGTY